MTYSLALLFNPKLENIRPRAHKVGLITKLVTNNASVLFKRRQQRARAKPWLELGVEQQLALKASLTGHLAVGICARVFFESIWSLYAPVENGGSL